jgi:hypothetical protein
VALWERIHDEVPPIPENLPRVLKMDGVWWIDWGEPGPIIRCETWAEAMWFARVNAHAVAVINRCRDIVAICEEHTP